MLMGDAYFLLFCCPTYKKREMEKLMVVRLFLSGYVKEN